jgi:S1-C subfamily serine protease
MSSPIIATLFALLLALSLSPQPAAAQTGDEAVERGKRRTAFVEVVTANGLASGSAFCIDSSGLFVTNAHVVEMAARRATDRLAGLGVKVEAVDAPLRHDPCDALITVFRIDIPRIGSPGWGAE